MSNAHREEYEKEKVSLKRLLNAKGKSAAISNLKEKVLGSKKGKHDPIAILDPKTGNEVSDARKIKEISLQYCLVAGAAVKSKA